MKTAGRLMQFLPALLIAIGLSVAASAGAQPEPPDSPNLPSRVVPVSSDPAPASPVLVGAPVTASVAEPVADVLAGGNGVTGTETASEVSLPVDASELALRIWGWVQTGEYALAVVALFMLAVFVIRLTAGLDRFSWLRWFKTRWGGWALNLSGSAGGAVLTGLLANQSLSAKLVLTGLVIGFAAAGGLEFFKDVKRGNKPIEAASG